VFCVVFLLLYCMRACDVPGQSSGSWQVTMKFGTKVSRRCDIIVTTIITDQYDHLLPITKDGPSVCWVAILDPQTFAAEFWRPEAKVKEEEEDVYVHASGWTAIREKNMFFGNNQCNARTLKALLHLFFPYSLYHLYIDANQILLDTPTSLISKYLQGNTVLAFVRSIHRDDVSEEIDRIRERHLSPDSIIEYQKSMYNADLNITTSNDYSTGGILLQGNWRLQRNIPIVHAFDCLWFSHIMDYSHRDQISLPKVLFDLDLMDNERVVVIPKRNSVKMKRNEHLNVRQRFKSITYEYPCRYSPVRTPAMDKDVDPVLRDEEAVLTLCHEVKQIVPFINWIFPC